MHRVELAEQIRQTKSLIAGDPTSIVLRRSAPVATGAGGRRRDLPVDQPAITCFFAPKVRDGMTVQDIQGERVVQHYILVAPVGTDIRDEDEFTLDGRDYRVTFVHTNLAYEVKADVVTVSSGYRT